MKKILSIALVIIMGILGIMPATTVAEEATAAMAIMANTAEISSEVADTATAAAEIGVDAGKEAQPIKASKRTTHANRARRKVRRIRSARKAKRNALRTAKRQAERLVAEMVAARPRIKRHRIRKLLTLPALMLCGLTAAPTRAMATANATSALWRAKAETAEQAVTSVKRAIIRLQAKLQVKQQTMALKQAELTAKRAELSHLKEIRKDLMKQYDDVDIVAAQHNVMAAEAKAAEAAEIAASVVIPNEPDLSIADKNIGEAKAKLETERTAIAKKYGTRSVPKYVMKEFGKLQKAYQHAVTAKESFLAHFAEANSEIANKLSAAVEAKQEVESCKAELTATQAKADQVANEIAKADNMIEAARNEKASIEHDLKVMQDEYTILYANVKPELDKAEANKAFAERKLKALQDRVAKEEAHEQAVRDYADKVRAYSTNDAGKHGRDVERILHGVTLHMWTDSLEMKSIVGRTKDDVMSKYHEALATFKPFKAMKMELTIDGVRMVKLFELRNGKLVQLHEQIRSDGKVQTIDMQFASFVAKSKNTVKLANGETLKGQLTGKTVSEGDYHGHGAYPNYQLVLLDEEHNVASSVCFEEKQPAMAAFEQLNLQVADSDWEAQLFEKLVLIRHTGDAIARAELDGQKACEVARVAMTEGGLSVKDANKIIEFFGVRTRKGEADLKKATIADLRAVPGIGKVKAEKAYLAIAGDILRDYKEDEAVTARYQSFIKLKLNQDGKLTETHVNVKVSRMSKYLTNICTNPDAPAMLYFEHEIKEEKDGAHLAATYTLRDYVQNGLYRYGVKYVPALHGTNAGKTCTTIWVQEPLRDRIRAFCTADGNMHAKVTPAKLNAYMGLMAVGTDDMPFRMKAKWLGIIPECEVAINDRAIMVNGEQVGEVENSNIIQKPFDGVIFAHFSKKAMNELLDAAQTPEEKIKIRNFIKEMESGSVRLIPWNKAMMIVGFDIHLWFREHGVKQINCVGRGMVDVDELVFFGTESVFKGSIGAEGTHKTWADYEEAVEKYGYQPGYVLHAHKPKKTNLPYQQIQCCSGISTDTVKEMVEEAVTEAKKLSTPDGVHKIAPSKEVAEILERFNQFANFELVAESLQKAFEDVYNTGMAGKLYNCAMNAFVAPDPIAFASWAAWNDIHKIQTAIRPWEVVLDHNMAPDCAEAIMSRNPCTDLSALVKVRVNKNFIESLRHYFRDEKAPMGVVFVSILDTAGTRLRMDFDGDHVNLCFIASFIKAVDEAVALWYPGEVRHPVIDWGGNKVDKTCLEDADMLIYYAELWHKSQLGHYMDLLNKLYASIACGAVKVDEKVKKAVAWLTYAVNVLVDASKHGMDKIVEPDYVKELNDLLFSKTVGNSKLLDGKEVDMEKVAKEYGDGILDMVAQFWQRRVSKVYALEGCDYDRDFDPRVLESHTRTTDFKDDPQGKDLVKAVKAEMESMAIYDFCNDSQWKFYPYEKDVEGNYTDKLVGATEFVRFNEGRRFQSFDGIKEAVNPVQVGEYIMVVVEDKTNVYYVFDLDEQNLPMLELVPGKWLNHEATGAKNLKYTGMVAILEGRKHEITDTYQVSGDKGERDRAAHDGLTLREYTKWSAQQSIRAYAALYGYTFEDAADKMLTWICKPVEYTVDQNNNLVRTSQPVNKWLFDFVMNITGDHVAKWFDLKLSGMM